MRYIVLVLINLPIILLALINILTRYKLKKTERPRFYRQLILWISTVIVLTASFPLYNLLNNKQLLDSSELSLFDIVEVSSIILLFYLISGQRQKSEDLEQRLQDLHQELSIINSTKK